MIRRGVLAAAVMAATVAATRGYAQERSPWDSLELSLSTGAAMSSVASSRFGASGTNGAALGASGASLGYDRVWAWTLGGTALYFPIRNLATGLHLDGDVGLEGPHGATAEVADKYGPANITFIHVAPELDAVVPIGRVSLRIGSRFGARFSSIGLSAPEFRRCATLNNSRCYGSASAADLYVEPQIGAFYKVGKYGVIGLQSGAELAAGAFDAPGLSFAFTFGLNATPSFGGKPTGEHGLPDSSPPDSSRSLGASEGG